jgi:hypothetical protein
MKRLVATCLLLTWVGWSSVGAGAEQTWNGSISDARCGGDHGGEVDERECTLRCVGTGDAFVLVTDYGKKVWPIANQNFADLRVHAGHTVKMTGELKDGAIVVSKIVM